MTAARSFFVVAHNVVTTSRLFKGWHVSSRTNSRSQHEAPATHTGVAGDKNVRVSRAYRRRVCWKGAAAGILMAFPAMADVSFEETGGGVRVVIANHSDPQAAIIRHTFTLPEGDIVVEEVITQNGNCWEPCPDVLRVVEFPEGFAAVPGDEIEVPEGGTGEILILPLGVS